MLSLEINATWCDVVPCSFFWVLFFFVFQIFCQFMESVGRSFVQSVCNWIDAFKRHFQIVADGLDHLFKTKNTQKGEVVKWIQQSNTLTTIKKTTKKYLPAKFAAAIPRRCFASIAPLKPRPNPKSTVRLELQKSILNMLFQFFIVSI